MLTSTKGEQLCWLVLIFFFCVTWLKEKKAPPFLSCSAAASASCRVTPAPITVTWSSLLFKITWKKTCPCVFNTYWGFFYISSNFNWKIKSLQYFRGKRAFTKGTLHIFSDSLCLCSIYLCLSNMEVLIVVVNDRVFRTTGSDETNALFPR